MGFIVGMLIGAIAGLLYAPKSGDTLRDELRVRSDELRRRADELQRVAQKIANDAQQKGRELVDEAKTEWTTANRGTGAGTGTMGSPGMGGTSGGMGGGTSGGMGGTATGRSGTAGGATDAGGQAGRRTGTT